MDDAATLGAAREWLRQRVDNGAKCPCCTQFAKVYRRKINSGMAHALIQMYRHAGTEWFYLPNITSRWQGRDEAGLRYWLLVDELQEKREDGGRAWWRITPLGERFVMRQIRVAKYARIYDGRCLSLTGEPVSITDALGDRFDYNELMGNNRKEQP
jgi:hypothetical protein